MSVREAIQMLLKWENLDDPLMCEVDTMSEDGTTRKQLIYGEVTNVTVGYSPCIKVRNPELVNSKELDR